MVILRATSILRGQKDDMQYYSILYRSQPPKKNKNKNKKPLIKVLIDIYYMSIMLM
jgi:hypothetical protein